MASGLPLVVAGASKGASQIEEVAQMSVNAATIDLIRLPLAKSKGKRLEYFLRRAFGCWHSSMSRPITAAGETYRACLACGARRRFDPKSWTMNGPYYFENENITS
jgi:hypothetical protein